MVATLRMVLTYVSSVEGQSFSLDYHFQSALWEAHSQSVLEDFPQDNIN